MRILVADDLARVRYALKNLLDHAGVFYRVPDPMARGMAPYLGDNIEPVSISANLVYNNMREPRRIVVRTPFAPRGYVSAKVGDAFETEVQVPGFNYVALQPEQH